MVFHQNGWPEKGDGVVRSYFAVSRITHFVLVFPVQNTMAGPIETITFVHVKTGQGENRRRVGGFSTLIQTRRSGGWKITINSLCETVRCTIILYVPIRRPSPRRFDRIKDDFQTHYCSISTPSNNFNRERQTPDWNARFSG